MGTNPLRGFHVTQGDFEGVIMVQGHAALHHKIRPLPGYGGEAGIRGQPLGDFTAG